MRGKENTRPVTVFEGPRTASPSGPGVSALMEKFGGRAAGGSRPVSYPAPKVVGSSSPGQPHQAVTRKPFGYNRIEETPKRRTGEPESPTGNVSALKELFGGNKAGVSTPTSRQTNTPLTKATPGVRGSPTTTSTTTPTRYGAGNRWSSKNNYRNLDESKSSDSESDASRTSTPTPNRTSTVTTTTTTTTGVSALRSRFKDNAEVKTASGQESTNPEKRRKIEEERKRSEAAVQKENEKNRSPKKQWSSKKEAKVNDRDVSSAKDTSPRKRKGVMLNKIGGVAKAKTKQEPKEAKETVTMRTPIGSTNDEEAKEWARALITKRTSALISGINNLPKTTTTPSRVQFEETVPKRTRREEKPKERPKTEYSFQNVQTPRPKSIADTKEIFSSPMSGNTSPAQSAKIIKNPTTKTQKLLQWCQIHTQGYDGVSVTNFHTSWADGLAFCALVHKFKPTAFNFNSLNGSNRRHNFDLAFQAAEEHFSVPQLLETEDMIEMGDKPDWKCVFTYVTALYAGLNKHAN
ncbi:uncharacterized protein [Diadema antillarum]|uniref:uncharacterized protein n=1 Tax=Diadema antillarum TaxID=105358 RepID=UPI003A88E3A0